VEFQVGSVDSDNVTESVDEWEVLELGGINDKLGVLESLGLGELGWVDNLHGADEHLV